MLLVIEDFCALACLWYLNCNKSVDWQWSFQLVYQSIRAKVFGWNPNAIELKVNIRHTPWYDPSLGCDLGGAFSQTCDC